jgi:hypothetical protein
MGGTDCLKSALERIANTTFSFESFDGLRDRRKIRECEFSVMKIVLTQKTAEKQAMKSQFAKKNVGYWERERSIQEKLNYPLILPD